MRIKRTVKDGYDESGKTEIIGDERMKNIIRQTNLLFTQARSKEMNGIDENMLRLQEGRTIETFYATYQPLST